MLVGGCYTDLLLRSNPTDFRHESCVFGGNSISQQNPRVSVGHVNDEWLQAEDTNLNPLTGASVPSKKT